MAVKLSELHKLMTDKGMTESVNLIQKCTEVSGKSIHSNMSFTQNNNNINNNVNVAEIENSNKGDCDSESKSIETIYESAVPKRSSSSSEDDFAFNSSDEVQQIQDKTNASQLFNKINPIVG